jgi:hyaluronate lyase
MRKSIFLSLFVGLVVLMLGFVNHSYADTYQSDFCNQIGSWTNLTGQSTQSINFGQLKVTNQKVGASYENESLFTDAGVRCSGDVEMTFVYNGQTNFGLVFRAGATGSYNYESFAYEHGGIWQLGQPGGHWISTITSPALVVGTTYRLLIEYQGTSIQAYLNGTSIYNNSNVTYSDGSSITSSWNGNVGLRFFGNASTLTLLSLKSGDFGTIPAQLDSTTFRTMQNKWKQQLVSNGYDASNSSVVSYVSKLSTSATTLYQSMDQTSSRTTLWPLKTSDTASADLTTQFSNLYTLAQAYGTEGSVYYQNTDVLAAIEGGLDFMVNTRGYNGSQYYGNWWDFQVGIPQNFVQILMIIGNQLSATKLAQYTTIIHDYLPNPYQQLYTKAQGVFVPLSFIPNYVTTGANRTDMALSILGLGIINQDENLVELASDSIKSVFSTVTSGDGFYADGSFVQHNNIPYTGAYGNVLVKGVSQIFDVTNGTTYAMDSGTINTFINLVKSSFLPLIVQGEMIPGVNGRSISRAPLTTQMGFGSSTMYNLLMVAGLAQSDAQKTLEEDVKYWMLEDPDYYLNNVRNYNDLQMTLALMSDATISGSNLPYIGTKMFASMDRFVQSTSNYYEALSLYSSRMSSFEAGNGENKHGWHTSDGMLYLYNNDGVQFGNSYWPTVDPYRLPGTTVDTVVLQDENSSFTTVTAPESWVGGVINANQAVVGMSLNKSGTKNNGTVLPMNLAAKKSWFIVNGQTVALGAGITGTTTADIETVIDDRLLNNNYNYRVISNNGVITSSNETSQKNWLLLNCDHQNASIGYYFPTGENVNVVNEQRTGSYSAINNAFPGTQIYTGTYDKFIINHGNAPVNDSYAYVELPGATQALLAAYNDLTILSNTRDIQAVQLANENYLGINFWDTTGGTINGITSDGAVSLMKQVIKGQEVYTISDPTQSNGIIHVQLPNDFSQVISLSNGISFDSTTNTAAINFSGATGSGLQIVVQ